MSIKPATLSTFSQVHIFTYNFQIKSNINIWSYPILVSVHHPTCPVCGPPSGKFQIIQWCSFTCRNNSNYLSGTRMAWSYSNWPMGWKFQGLNPRRDTSLFFSLKYMHQGWGPPPTLIHNGHQTKHLGNAHGFHLHLELRVGMSGDISLLPDTPPLYVQGQIYFLHYLITYGFLIMLWAAQALQHQITAWSVKNAVEKVWKWRCPKPRHHPMICLKQ